MISSGNLGSDASTSPRGRESKRWYKTTTANYVQLRIIHNLEYVRAGKRVNQRRRSLKTGTVVLGRPCAALEPQTRCASRLRATLQITLQTATDSAYVSKHEGNRKQQELPRRGLRPKPRQRLVLRKQNENGPSPCSVQGLCAMAFPFRVFDQQRLAWPKSPFLATAHARLHVAIQACDDLAARSIVAIIVLSARPSQNDALCRQHVGHAA